MKIIMATAFFWLIGNAALMYRLGIGRSRAFWRDMFHRATQSASTPIGQAKGRHASP
jgi:hypothetical protein